MKRFVTLFLAVVMGALPVSGSFGLVMAAPAKAELKATVVSASAPLTLRAGEFGEMEVVVQNAGTAVWSNAGENAVNLGTIRPMDHAGKFAHASWLGTNRPATMQEETVNPGETAHFKFSVMAAGHGKIIDYFDVVMERVGWFGLTIPLTVDVQPASWQGVFVSQSIGELELKTQETATVTVKVRNTGDVAWSQDGAAAVKIGTAGPLDRASNLYHPSWLSKNRVGVASDSVAPGTEGEFVFTIQAPTKTGVFQESFGLVAEITAWMPVRFNLTVRVVPAIWAAEFVGQSANNISLSPGDTAELWAEYKNTGNTTWLGDGMNAVKLGTTQGSRLTSVFKSELWLSDNRVAAVQPAEVKPGEVGRFSFVIKAPNKIGVYKEYFRPVVEWTTWLPGEIYWDISVEEELVLKDPIRVGITSTTDSITIQGDNFVVRQGTDRTMIKKVPGGSVEVSATKNGFELDNEEVNDYLRFVPLNKSLLKVKTAGIGATYNTFRGIVEVRRSSLSGNVWVVNTLELEDYLKGIAEVPEGWPVEAQKAQMVAARTYAATKLKAPVADIFDIYDDTRDQVYYGYNYESSRPNLSAAAVSTQGMIIKYNGQPISAYYFSDSGGYTANVEEVWSQTIPYLRAVSDPYAKPIEWSVTLTQEYLQGRFDEALGIEPGEDEIVDMEVSAKYTSGRVKTVLATLGSGKKVSLSSKSFDYLTNNNDIKSMLFEIEPTGSKSSPDFVFTGKGWGHGVGLAQWGARNMAVQGKTYQDILTYYYTGVAIGPR